VFAVVVAGDAVPYRALATALRGFCATWRCSGSFGSVE